MPQGSERLRDKFMVDGDGIVHCENIINKAGGIIDSCIIRINCTEDQEVLDAIQFLIEEWDYGYEPK